MKEKKGTYEQLKKIRRKWTISPVTRVAKNRLLDKKKLRRDAQKEIKEGDE